MNKVIVVTGASSGIGFSIIEKLQQLNYTVVAASRNIESDVHVAENLKNGSIAKNLNVEDQDSVASFFLYVREKFGSIYCLVNCAGYVNPTSLFSTTLEDWKKTINVNLTGTFLCTKYAALIMKSNGGRIVNIASTAGLTPRPGWSAYAAAKSGVINFSSAISEELAQYGIKVFILCPGRTATPLRKILAPTEDPSTIMQPERVADFVLYCLQDESDIIEGQPILVRERF